LSVWLFDERFTDSPAKIAIAALPFAVMTAGVTVLSRQRRRPHPLVAGQIVTDAGVRAGRQLRRIRALTAR